MDDISDSLFTMLQLQRALNDREDTQWYTKQTPFLRAVLMSAAASLEHYGCNLWANTTPDLARVHGDMNGTLYALLAHTMTRKGRRDEELYRIAKEIETVYQSIQRKDTHFGLDFPEKMELLAAKSALHEDMVLWPVFFSAIRDVDLSWETLSRAYFSEYVLKLFRKDYGESTGKYKAIWGDKADTIHLEEIIAGMKTLDLPAIRHALVMRYSVLAGRRATDQSDAPKQ